MTGYYYDHNGKRRGSFGVYIQIDTRDDPTRKDRLYSIASVADVAASIIVKALLDEFFDNEGLQHGILGRAILLQFKSKHGKTGRKRKVVVSDR